MAFIRLSAETTPGRIWKKITKQSLAVHLHTYSLGQGDCYGCIGNERSAQWHGGSGLDSAGNPLCSAVPQSDRFLEKQ